jgi:glycine cleavage system H lipoate-binding protein
MTATRKKTRRPPVVFNVTNEQCVWAQAGVIKPTRCINHFDCLDCSLDKKVLRSIEEKERHAAALPRQQLLLGQRKCRHMLSGRVSYKLCSRAFDCVRCPYDQMLEDSDLAHPYGKPVLEYASGFALGRDHYYHHGHTWARVEYGGRVRVGIDDFALKLLGPADEIVLPRLGSKVAQSREQCVLRRGRNEAAALSPVDGTVVAINPAINRRAETANQSPYGEGWLMVIEPRNLRRNLKNLLFGEESLAWMDDEAARLGALVAEETGQQMAATGGEVIGDIYGTFPELGWDRLVNTFLR